MPWRPAAICAASARYGLASAPGFAALIGEQLRAIEDTDERRMLAVGLVGALAGLFTGYLDGTLVVPRERLVAHCVALLTRAEARLSSISQDQPIEIRAQAADFAARNLREAESELEKLVRSDYTTVVAWPQLGAAERAAYNLDRINTFSLRRKVAKHVIEAGGYAL